MKVAFHTLGCKVNHYETEAIKEAFVSRGAEIVGEEEFADVYIINTCTVTNIADRKSRQFIRRAKRINPDALLAVTGCYAQVSADEIAAMPEVDLVVGNGRKSEICGLVMQRLQDVSAAESAAAENTSAVTKNTSDAVRSESSSKKHADVLVLPREELTFYEDMGRIKAGSDGMTRAYIKIQDGCDRFCSYCLIPYARGPVRSRPAAEIVEEVRALVEAGHREIVLTGINTALYGTEAGAEHSLSQLLTMLDELDAPSGRDFRIRLSSLEPTVVDKDNVEEIIRHRRLCHHLHLSVQNGSDAVLKSMNRHYTRAEYLEIVRALRDYDEDFGITTDIIVGFPGETEEDFRDTLDIVKEAFFGKTHVFRYSPRKGTAGAKLKAAVPEEVKKERAGILEESAEEVARDFRLSITGKEQTVLIEEEEDGYLTGYTGNYIKAYIKAAESAELGKGVSCDSSLSVKTPEPGEFCKVIPTGLFRDGVLASQVR
ncbi:MAG: tRNA (N(6)-L-threonylcarbamoyladenosine(37)-C(2))-methylthiotransferase MtaB [Mogibacterium sp.]|nr:tRNA (N(6)-L-threonylcarbamoyladenosine(37)-C(2))-methylthiotransferase MtaB [Mogibacterium sp.]